MSEKTNGTRTILAILGSLVVSGCVAWVTLIKDMATVQDIQTLAPYVADKPHLFDRLDNHNERLNKVEDEAHAARTDRTVLKTQQTVIIQNQEKILDKLDR